MAELTDERYRAILGDIVNMSAQQRKELSARLALLSAPSKQPIDRVLVVLRGLLPSIPPTVLLKHHRRYPKFVDQCRAFETFIEKHIPASKFSLVGPQRIQLMVILVQAAMRMMEAKHIPATVWTIGSWLGDIGAVADRSFPGYMSSGMLDKLVGAVRLRR